MFEHHKSPLIGRREFIKRQVRYLLFSLLILSVSLSIGIAGYHFWGKLPWIDSFLNASMILTGMGPVDHLDTRGGKFFSACYALFSGVSFLTFVAVLFTPLYHRFLHKFHLSIEDDEKSRDEG